MDLVLSENKKYLLIEKCSKLEYKQLRNSLTKRIEGWRFHPLVKSKKWDGFITHLKGNKIPSGLWKEIIDICKDYDLQASMKGVTTLFDTDINEDIFREWVDEFFKDNKITPRDYQIEAAFKILKYRRCLAELATSAGKTLISFMVIAYLLSVLRKKRILMIVPNVSLVIQAAGDFEEYNLGQVPLRIQQIYSGMKMKDDSNIVVGTYQSLVKKKEEYFKQFDVVLIDETHKAKASSIQTILNKCWHCDYRFGLSGTIPKRGTLNRLTLMASTGPLVVQVKANFLQSKEYISKCEVLQLELQYATDEQLESFFNLSKSKSKEAKDLFNLEKNFIINHERRLDFVCKMVNNRKGNSLVLFHKIEYGENIYNRLRSMPGDKRVYYVDGTVNTDIREDIKEKMEKGDDIIIVASYGTFSTGISIKKIHNIFLTESFKKDVIIRQSIGRGLRKHESKDTLYIFDFVDDFRYMNKATGDNWMNYVYRHGLERRKIYREEKFPYKIHEIKI